MLPDVTSVCVFCGSSYGRPNTYRETARDLARELVRAEVGVVYGGADVGLMKTVADTALAAGGRVTGVIPRGLFSREIAHLGLTELIEVGSMHERKQRMFEISDAFVALPGGLGTLEEVAEIATWSQLGLHAKPIVLVDVDGFWRPLLGQLDRCVAEGFLSAENRRLVVDVTDPLAVLDAIRAYDVPEAEKWIGADET